MILDHYQTKVLNMLLDNYEGSATFKGINQKSQTFLVSPEKVMEDYKSDYANINDIHHFHESMKELEDKQFVALKYDRYKHELKCIVLNMDFMADIYKLLDRKDKKSEIQKQIDMYNSYLGIHEMIDAFIRSDIQRLEEHKKPEFPCETAENLILLWRYLLENKEPIMERELSQEVLKDTKLLENRYRSSLYRILEKYGPRNEWIQSIENKNEQMKALFEEYQLYSNPSYIYFKGSGTIMFEGHENSNKKTIFIELNPYVPLAICSDSIKNIKSITVNDSKIMTIENLTAFNRYKGSDMFLLYLGGYHNTAKQLFLKMIYENNKEKTWMHFGDIDPDGIYILYNLIHKTGIPFVSYRMGISTLEEYSDYTKPLEEADIKKAKNMISQGIDNELMEYMLLKRRKLEQEIICWKER